MLGIGLGLWNAAIGEGSYPELRSTGATGLVGTVTAASYDGSTGEGSVTRVDAANQSFVGFAAAAGRQYKIDIAAGSGAVLIRAGSSGGTILGSVNSGQRQTLTVSTGATTMLTVTASAAATATFTVYSLKLT